MTSERMEKHSRDANQGEGDRVSAARYNEEAEKFAKSGKVKEAARKASRQDPREAERSERAGRKHAKEEDPNVHREYSKGEK